MEILRVNPDGTVRYMCAGTRTIEDGDFIAHVLMGAQQDGLDLQDLADAEDCRDDELMRIMCSSPEAKGRMLSRVWERMRFDLEGADDED